jgi:hypothetical protein
MPSSSRAWTIKGVSDRTRDAVHQAAQAEGLDRVPGLPSRPLVCSLRLLK